MKAVIFDLDDTLYEERQFVYSGYRAVSAWIKNNFDLDIYYEIKALFDSGFRGDVFTPVLSKYIDVDEDYVKSLVQIYRNHIPKIELFDDAKVVLDMLSGKYKLGIITDGYLNTQKNKVKSLNIENLFDFILYSDIYGREYWKPNVKLYEECLKALGVNPAESIYIGDNPSKDFVNAKIIGMKTIRVRRENGEHCKVCLPEEFEADYEISNLWELPDVIEGI